MMRTMGLQKDGISFIIPTWNHELVLPRSIRSALKAGDLLRDRGLGVEIFIVDDASRDGSRVLLRQIEALYADRGVRVLSLTDNRGPCGARNIALELVRYRYIVFMDADNEAASENMHHFYRAIRETGAAVAYGNLLLHTPFEDATGLCSHESFQDRMFGDNYIDTFAMCDAEQLLELEGFWQDKRNDREDWELFLHLAASGRRLVHVPILIGHYYRNRMSRNESACAEQGGARLIHRVYDQFTGLRGSLPLNTRHLRYHPDVGWL